MSKQGRFLKRGYLVPARAKLAEAFGVVSRPASFWKDLVDQGYDFLVEERHVNFRRDVGYPWQGAAIEITDPQAAWEALAVAGLIPMQWVDDPRHRMFEQEVDCGYCGGSGDRGDAQCTKCWPWGSGKRVDGCSFPRKIGFCVALASDASGVAAAEELVREVYPRAQVNWDFLLRGDAKSEYCWADHTAQLIGPDRGQALLALGYAVQMAPTQRRDEDLAYVKMLLPEV